MKKLYSSPEMSSLKSALALCLVGTAALFTLPANAYDFAIGESGYLEIKGDLTYSVKFRVENPDPGLKDDSKGNSNFDKGDLVNNKAIARTPYYMRDHAYKQPLAQTSNCAHGQNNRTLARTQNCKHNHEFKQSIDQTINHTYNHNNKQLHEHFIECTTTNANTQLCKQFIMHTAHTTI